MKIINGQVHFKVVFFGTALAGKTTSLKWLFENAIPPEFKITGSVRSLETSFGQTLFFDFTPIRLAPGVFVRLYATTGQDYYTKTRQLLFEDVDGVFFVVDSQKKELEHNREFVREYRDYQERLAQLRGAEVVVLYNKQDEQEVFAPGELGVLLDLEEYASYPVCALKGDNLGEAFIHMLDRLLGKMRQGSGNAISQ